MPRLTAVTIPPMQSTRFVVDFTPDSIPATIDWHDWPIVHDVRVEVPADLHDWPDDDETPEAPTLCVSKADPRSYRVFKRSAEIPEDGYDRTDSFYAGIYSQELWEQVTQRLPRVLEAIRRFESIGAEDSSVADEVVHPIRTAI